MAHRKCLFVASGAASQLAAHQALHYERGLSVEIKSK